VNPGKILTAMFISEVHERGYISLSHTSEVRASSTQPPLPSNFHPKIETYSRKYSYLSCGVCVRMRSMISDLKDPHTVAFVAAHQLKPATILVAMKFTAWHCEERESIPI
jgi:hypothetical protein